MFLRRKKSKTDLLKEQVSELTDKAVEGAARAATTLAPKVELARESAREAATLAYEAATPHVTKAKAAAAPAVAAALVKAASVLPSHEEEPPKKKGGKLKKLLALVGLGGIAYGVSKKVQGSSSASASVAPPRPTPVPNPAPNPDATPTPVPPLQVDEPADEATAQPLVDGGDTNPAGDDDGHAAH